MFLLIGTQKALLIDTGAEADEEKMPLARTVQGLLPDNFPLVVAHTHSHSDHREGDAQFESRTFTKIVPPDLEGIKGFYNLENWPNDLANVDLGDRLIYIIPTPGHNPNHMVFYDEKTGLLLAGDFLFPGRLLIDDIEAYKESAGRVIDFIRDRPVSHILGGHIELNSNGKTFSQYSNHHPNEKELQLSKADLLALPAALDNFNNFYSEQGNFILSNPINNLLALSILIVLLIIIAIWGARRLRK